MKKISLIFVLGLCSSVFNTCFANTISMPAAQGLGLVDRPILKASKQAIVAGQKNESSTRAGLLPQLSLSHTSNFSKVLSVNETAHTVGLQGSQIIFSPAGPALQSRIAELSTEQATHQFKATSNEVRRAVAIDFLQAWLLQEKKSLIDALATYTNYLERKNDQLLVEGSINQIKYRATAASITQNRATIANYALALASAKEALALSMGQTHQHMPLSHLAYTTKNSLPKAKPTDYYCSLAYENRPELKSSDAAQKQQELAARAQRLSYVPTISAQGSIGKTFAGAAIEQGVTANIGFSLQWNFFDGFGRVRAAEAADAKALRTTFERQELKNSIATNITTTLNSIIATEKLVSAARDQVLAQQAQLEQTQVMHSLGSVDDYTLAKDSYDFQDATFSLLSQEIALHTHWQNLAWHCGYPTTGVLDEY